jgi:hypothetical protein
VPESTPLPVALGEYEISIAGFRSKHLDECTDFAFVPNAGQESIALEAMKTLAIMAPDEDRAIIQLTKRCAEQFANRTVLATCVLDKSGTHGSSKVTSRYYELQNVRGHSVYMQNCLTMKGDWNLDMEACAAEEGRDHRQLLEDQLQKALATEKWE